MTRKRGNLKWIGLGFLGLMVLLVGAVFALMLASSYRLRKEMAKEHVMTLDDLARIKVPPEKNGAVLYERAFTLMHTPEFPKESRNCKEWYGPAGEASPSDWAEVRKLVVRYRQAIELVEQAASKPRCWFPVKWKDGNGALFPHFSDMREISRLLRLAARLDARDGRMDHALHLTELSYKASGSLKDERTLMGQLNRQVMIVTADRTLKEVLQQGTISETQARRLFDYLGKIDLRPGFTRCLEGDRALGLDLFDKALKDPPETYRLLTGGFSAIAGGPAPETIRMKLAGSAWRTIQPLDRALYVEFVGKEIKALRSLTYRQARAKGLLPRESDIPSYAIGTRLIAPVYGRIAALRDTAAARIIGDQIFLALLAYKDRYGSYPATLKDLRAKLGWKIRQDPMSGRDFVYKLKGKNFILYSIGKNMKDDGGRPASASSRSTDDIVWNSKPDPRVAPPEAVPRR